MQVETTESPDGGDQPRVLATPHSSDKPGSTQLVWYTRAKYEVLSYLDYSNYLSDSLIHIAPVCTNLRVVKLTGGGDRSSLDAGTELL